MPKYLSGSYRTSNSQSITLNVTSYLSIQACSRVAKNSARGQRPGALFLVARQQRVQTKPGVTQSTYALIVLLYALPILEQCWPPKVYFVHHNNLFIES